MDWEADSPEQCDAALGGGGHGAVVVDGVLGGDVVLQEQALGVLLLQGVPLAGILWGWRGAQLVSLPPLPPLSQARGCRLRAENGVSAGPLTLLGSKSSLTLKLSTMHEADRQCSTQASSTSSRATLADSILRRKGRPVIVQF